MTGKGCMIPELKIQKSYITGNLPPATRLSGLDIEDAACRRGYERTARWRITDFEDPSFAIFCQDLFAELVPPLPEPSRQT